MKKVLIIGGIATVAAAGFLYYKNQIALLNQMTYAPVGFRFDSVGIDKSILIVDVKVQSGSRIEATVEKLVIDVYLNDIKVGTVTENKPLLIPAKGYSIVQLKVEFFPTQISQNIVSLASEFYNKKDFSLKIEGTAKAKSSFIKTTIPISYETTLKQITAPTSS